jgi:hypothetical protein
MWYDKLKLGTAKELILLPYFMADAILCVLSNHKRRNSDCGANWNKTTQQHDSTLFRHRI